MEKNNAAYHAWEKMIVNSSYGSGIKGQSTFFLFNKECSTHISAHASQVLKQLVETLKN